MLAPLLLSLTAALMQPAAPHAQVDHVILGIRSLEEGVAAFQKLTGVKPVVGGKHPGRGTENALVSLGRGTYLEIMAPQRDAALGPADRPLRELTELTVIGWAVRVQDVQDARARLQKVDATPSPATPGSRVTPSGTTLEWSTFGLMFPQFDIAPFFIHWADGTPHPSATSPRGCTLSRLEVQDPGADDLTRVLGAVGVEHVTISAAPTAITMTLACPSGSITFRTRQ